MRLLVSNDDGIDAPGIQALWGHLARSHEVWVVAPASERSAQSHALTMHKPLRLTHHGERRYAVNGTPADCIYLGLFHLLRLHPPDLVVSGINNGTNLGNDVHYSGTVAAAREACVQGFPAVAVSLERHGHDPGDGEPDGRGAGGARPELHWQTANDVVDRVLEALAAEPLPKGVLLNVNVPNRAKIRGIRAVRLGERYYAPMVDQRTDPRGSPYYWVGGPHSHFGEDPDTDGPALSAGWATVTPITADVTDRASLLRFAARFPDAG